MPLSAVGRDESQGTCWEGILAGEAAGAEEAGQVGLVGSRVGPRAAALPLLGAGVCSPPGAAGGGGLL